MFEGHRWDNEQGMPKESNWKTLIKTAASKLKYWGLKGFPLKYLNTMKKSVF